MKQIKVSCAVKYGDNAGGETIAVEDCGPFWITKSRWQDVGLPKRTKWQKIMGYTLTHKASGRKVGWFPNIAAASIAADELLIYYGEAISEVTDTITGHAARAALTLIAKWAEIYGDPHNAK